MSRIFLFFISLTLSLASYAESNDKLVADAIKSGDWFLLDSLYSVTPENTLSNYVEVCVRCLTGNRLNRPDISIPAFTELFSNYSDHLDLNETLNYGLMFSMDLSRTGDNARAASLLSSLIEANKSHLNTKLRSNLENFVNKYRALSQYNPYTITISGETGYIPFSYMDIGRPEDKGIHMRLDDSFVNGMEADITFDTGAGINVISDSLVNQYKLIPLDIKTKVLGARSQSGTFAIAPELRIGNITIKDVPFYVMNLTANNDEADKHMKKLKFIVGIELMLQLKDLTIDFADKRITVPAEPPVRTYGKPNLCFSSGMNLLAKGSIENMPVLMNVDTGDSSFGTIGSKFYNRNKKFIRSKGQKAQIRKAGVGGVDIMEGFYVPDMSLDLGGNKVTLPTFNVLTKTDPLGFECNLGLKSLKLYKKVRFNLVDFVLSTTD